MKGNNNPSGYAFNSDLFRKRLEKSIKERGYKNADLSRETGVTAATIGNYVNGNRIPRGFQEIVPLAKALDVSLDYLAGLSDEKAPQKDKFMIENYADAMRAIDSLTFCFQTDVKTIHHEAELIGYDPYDEKENYSEPYDEFVLTIRDNALCEFNRKRNALINALGDIIKIERYNLLYDDLAEEMKQTKVEKVFPDLPF